jgi:hypothetical protein
MAVTGDPGDATPPETWNQLPQPELTFHQVDTMRPLGSVVASWSACRATTVTVALARARWVPTANQLDQPLRSSHQRL